MKSLPSKEARSSRRTDSWAGYGSLENNSETVLRPISLSMLEYRLCTSIDIHKEVGRALTLESLCYKSYVFLTYDLRKELQGAKWYSVNRGMLWDSKGTSDTIDLPGGIL